MLELIEESDTRPLSIAENIALLDRRKRSLLHELKILSITMNGWIVGGVISQMGETSKYPNAPVIPESETRCILTEDPLLKEKVLKTYARFANVREILSNGVMADLEELEKQAKNEVSCQIVSDHI